jgi:hypothetical protein
LIEVVGNIGKILGNFWEEIPMKKFSEKFLT